MFAEIVCLCANILSTCRQLRDVNFAVFGKLSPLRDGVAARQIVDIIQRCGPVAKV